MFGVSIATAAVSPARNIDLGDTAVFSQSETPKHVGLNHIH